LADCIYKIGASVNSDIGDGLRKLGEAIREQETRREELARYLVSDMIAPVRQAAENDSRELLLFEKNYKKDRDQLRSEILKLEAKTRKAGKKTSPESLKSQIQELNDRIKEAEVMRGNKLRDVILLERKKYGNFLSSWNYFVAREVDNHTAALNNFKASEANWTALAASINTAPKDVEDMIRKQERTLVQIQPDDSAGRSTSEEFKISYNPGSQGPSTYSSYADYDNSYDNQYNSETRSSTDYGSNNSGYSQARALYDYTSEEATDLPLVQGELIDVVQHDDGSGWTKGSNQSGQVGIFPTSYIQYL